jgi:hypothetical protein
MNTQYQEELAEIAGESVAYARAMRRNSVHVLDLRRILVTAAGDDGLHGVAAQLQADLAKTLADHRWYLIRRKRRGRHCHPMARYHAKLSWGESVTLFRIHRALARKVSVYEYHTLADAVRDVALVSRRSGYTGILGTELAGNAAAHLTRDCYLRPRTIPATLASGQATFFAMLTADRQGLDLYWHRQAEPITVAARSLVVAIQTT